MLIRGHSLPKFRKKLEKSKLELSGPDQGLAKESQSQCQF